jgi:hypothetical protein
VLGRQTILYLLNMHVLNYFFGHKTLLKQYVQTVPCGVSSCFDYEAVLRKKKKLANFIAFFWVSSGSVWWRVVSKSVVDIDSPSFITDVM